MGSRSKGKVIIAVGLPGSGKSTYFARRGIHPLCSDMLRLWLLDDEADQRYQPWIFGALRYLLSVRLELRFPESYVDATNLTRSERKQYLRLGARYGCDVEAIFFDVPLAVCLKRNQRRSRPVPPDAIEGMARKLRPPALDEGFSKIKVVRPGLRKRN